MRLENVGLGAILLGGLLFLLDVRAGIAVQAAGMGLVALGSWRARPHGQAPTVANAKQLPWWVFVSLPIAAVLNLVGTLWILDTSDTAVGPLIAWQAAWLGGATAVAYAVRRRLGLATTPDSNQYR